MDRPVGRASGHVHVHVKEGEGETHIRGKNWIGALLVQNTIESAYSPLQNTIESAEIDRLIIPVEQSQQGTQYI